jgi:hypothetical protein
MYPQAAEDAKDGIENSIAKVLAVTTAGERCMDAERAYNDVVTAAWEACGEAERLLDDAPGFDGAIIANLTAQFHAARQVRCEHQCAYNRIAGD